MRPSSNGRIPWHLVWAGAFVIVSVSSIYCTFLQERRVIKGRLESSRVVVPTGKHAGNKYTELVVRGKRYSASSDRLGKNLSAGMRLRLKVYTRLPFIQESVESISGETVNGRYMTLWTEHKIYPIGYCVIIVGACGFGIHRMLRSPGA